MKRALRLVPIVALLSLLGACTAGADPTTTTALSSPSTAEPTPTTTLLPTLDGSVPQINNAGDIVGALLDGTPYTVLAEPRRPDEEIVGATAAIAVELADESAFLEVSVEAGPVAGASWEGDAYLLPVGDWSVRIAGVPPDKREMRQAVEGIVGRESFGLPVLDLASPLRWATDIETETVMQVEYSTLSVRRGCRTLASVCSSAHGVQVSNLNGQDEDHLWIESPSARPSTNAWFLDPGPLVARGGHQVIWTGDELIVWGGSVADTPPNLTDGAAYGPASSTWRKLAPSPIEARQQTAAVWAGERMIVVSRDATVAYDPKADTWETIGDGIGLSGNTLIHWTGAVVAVWVPDGISSFEPRTGRWTKLPHPGFGEPDRWEGSLLSARGGLIAVGLDTPACSGRLASRWNGVEWDPLPAVDLSTSENADCGLANQAAVVDDHLIVWEDDQHPTMAFDFRTDTWGKIDTIPLSGSEGASGAINVGSGILIPQRDQAAWLPSVDANWILLDMPGLGSDLDMTWTGNEVVMWGATCCYGSSNTQFTIDAWRWTMLGP